jgi:hypothetical protein
MFTTHYSAHLVPGQTLLQRVARIGISAVLWPKKRPSLGGGVPDKDNGWFVRLTMGRFAMILDHSGPMLFVGIDDNGKICREVSA